MRYAQYRYDVIGAYEAGEKRHPQIAIRELYPTVIEFHPAPIGDCWLFTAGISSFDEPPAYIEVIDVLP